VLVAPLSGARSSSPAGDAATRPFPLREEAATRSGVRRIALITGMAAGGWQADGMDIADLLVDAFGRVREAVHGAVTGLTEEQLAARLDLEANSIAWLVWHLTRIQDDHVADVAGTEQAWMAEGWADRFGLPFPQAETGYGHSSAQVAAVRVSADLLVGYHEAVFGHTVKYVRGLGEADLDRVVDEHWDPPVTLGVRLVSVVDDDLEHAGQAAFVRGVLERRRG
jgi:hypothetical protein